MELQQSLPSLYLLFERKKSKPGDPPEWLKDPEKSPILLLLLTIIKSISVAGKKAE